MELLSEAIAVSPTPKMPSSRRKTYPPSIRQGSQSAACVAAAAGEVAERWCVLRTGVVGRGVARFPFVRSSRSRSDLVAELKATDPARISKTSARIKPRYVSRYIRIEGVGSLALRVEPLSILNYLHKCCVKSYVSEWEEKTAGCKPECVPELATTMTSSCHLKIRLEPQSPQLLLCSWGHVQSPRSSHAIWTLEEMCACNNLSRPTRLHATDQSRRVNRCT